MSNVGSKAEYVSSFPSTTSGLSGLRTPFELELSDRVRRFRFLTLVWTKDGM